MMMDFLPFVLVAIVVYLFWIRPKISTKKLSNITNNSLLKYGIKGMEYRKLNTKVHPGVFIGYICNESENPIDKDAIAIHHCEGIHLGYIPRWKTEELKYLFGQELDNSVKIFGILSYDSNTKNWSGIIYAPNQIDINQQEKLYKILVKDPHSFDNLEWA